MQPNNTNRVIGYLPGSDVINNADGAYRPAQRRGFLSLYINQLGRDYDLVLRISLAFQLFLAMLVAWATKSSLWILADWDAQGGFMTVAAFAGALVLTALIQVIILAELGQIVWQRRLERVRVQLARSSAWWWLMFGALVTTCLLDVLLIFMAFTGRKDLWLALQLAASNNFSLVLALMVCVLAILTAVRCGFVMNTTSVEEVQREIKSEMDAPSLEVLHGLSEQARNMSMRAIEQSEINVNSFVPLTVKELDYLVNIYKDLLPKVWLENATSTIGYDFDSNRLVALPPSTHKKLKTERHKALEGRGVLSRMPSTLTGRW